MHFLTEIGLSCSDLIKSYLLFFSQSIAELIQLALLLDNHIKIERAINTIVVVGANDLVERGNSESLLHYALCEKCRSFVLGFEFSKGELLFAGGGHDIVIKGDDQIFAFPGSVFSLIKLRSKVVDRTLVVSIQEKCFRTLCQLTSREIRIIEGLTGEKRICE